jgi:CheY-like chemotaxis protein
MHIVHLEDDHGLRELLQVSLTAARPSIQLIQFESGDETLDYAAKHLHEIDLFILDIRVPGDHDGLAVTRRLREMEYQGLIVITSAYGKPRHQFLEQYSATWMAKPWYIVDAARTFINMVAEYHKQANDGQNDVHVIQCPNCNYENKVPTTFCGKCGTSLAGVKPEPSTKKIPKNLVQERILSLDPATTQTVDEFRRMKLSLLLDNTRYHRLFDFNDFSSIILGRKGVTSRWTETIFVDLMPYQGYAKGVSRQHLRIQKNGTRLEIMDLGSSNGSFLWGEKLKPFQVYPINNNDEVLLGQLKVRLVFTEKETENLSMYIV